jgi:Type IV secretion system pilin
MNKILTFKNFLLIATLTLFSVSMLSFATSPSVSAQDDRLKHKTCAGSNFNLDPNAPGNNCAQGAGQSALNNFIDRAVNIFSIIVGIIAVIMIIVGGLKFITAGGDSGRISSARQTIIYAIIGLIIVALAQIIVRFVLGQTI